MDVPSFTKYDDVLTSILVNEKSILGFLSAIFNFLGRRTDFYYVPQGPHENVGFPPGVAEELVLKVMRKCDPKNIRLITEGELQMHDDIMCSTVAQEVEIVAEEDEIKIEQNEDVNSETVEQNYDVYTNEMANLDINNTHSHSDIFPTVTTQKSILDDYKPPEIPVQNNSEAYNGAVRDLYSWAQTIMELDVTIKLPPDIKSAKDLKVVITPNNLAIQKRNGDIMIQDTFPYKIKSNESVWNISGGRLLIHLEKVQERWWNKLFNGEAEIDLSKIDCSRPLDELPEEHVAKVRELQWNQERKLQGLPTSDQLKNIEILRKAWNADGSPFKGKEFDPNMLHQS